MPERAASTERAERIFLAGQITGVEGYMESTPMGLMAGISALMTIRGKDFFPPPPTTCVGSLIRYLTTENTNFQPMNINFGLFEGYSEKNKGSLCRKMPRRYPEMEGRH